MSGGQPVCIVEVYLPCWEFNPVHHLLHLSTVRLVGSRRNGGTTLGMLKLA